MDSVWIYGYGAWFVTRYSTARSCSSSRSSSKEVPSRDSGVPQRQQTLRERSQEKQRGSVEIAAERSPRDNSSRESPEQRGPSKEVPGREVVTVVEVCWCATDHSSH